VSQQNTLLKYTRNVKDCCFISKQKIESIIEELQVHLPTKCFEELTSTCLDFNASKQFTLGFYPQPKDKKRPQPPRVPLRHNKEKPIPFAEAPRKHYATSQNQAFQFYLHSLRESEQVHPAVVQQLFVIIREVCPPKFEPEPSFMSNLDQVFLILESRQFELCQMKVNRMILEIEEKSSKQDRLAADMVAYLSYLKGLFFDLDGDMQKALYFYNEALLKLRQFPETGASADVFFGMGCLFYNHGKFDLACKCFVKAKNLRDQYASEESINLGVSTHHSGFILNNVACCLVQFSNSY
jgi:tetratricopeptide (TPR) repeat protein